MEIQGQEVLSLQDALRCSTHLSIRWCHHKILRPTCDFLQMHLHMLEFFWFKSDAFLKRSVSSFWDSYVKFLPGVLWAKVVLERTTYRLLEESRKEYLHVSLQADSALTCHHEQNASGTLRIKMNARKGCWAISLDSRASQPLRF